MPEGSAYDGAVEVPCPKCGRRTRVQMAELRGSRTFVCAHCKREVPLGPEQMRAILDHLGNAIEASRRKLAEPGRSG